jgi:AcrR family transcriptional regulator
MGIHERKEREKEFRKVEIVDAAQKVFFEKGLQDATMDEIAEAAELSKGTLYIYYKSKEDLYLTVLMRGMQILYNMFERTLSSEKPMVERLWQLGTDYYNFFESNKNFFRMFHFFQTPQLHKQVSNDMTDICRTMNHKLRDLVIHALQKAMEEGLIRSDLNPMDIYIIIWSSSTALLLRIDSEEPFWRDMANVDLRKTLRTSNTLLFNSLLTEQGRKAFLALQQ